MKCLELSDLFIWQGSFKALNLDLKEVLFITLHLIARGSGLNLGKLLETPNLLIHFENLSLISIDEDEEDILDSENEKSDEEEKTASNFGERI